jgi:hypothetical protein
LDNFSLSLSIPLNRDPSVLTEEPNYGKLNKEEVGIRSFFCSSSLEFGFTPILSPFERLENNDYVAS